MLELENKYYNKGYELIAGIDEVGRGCLAGDVVACAIIMPKGLRIEGVKDSKKLSQKKREELYQEILDAALAVGIGSLGPEDIDRINIKQATRFTMKFAVENIRTRENKGLVPDILFIDAEEIDSDIEQVSIVKGDDKSHSIACASIVAKVYRDNMCKLWDQEYPGYNIKKHKGYGTKEHRENIIELGPSKIHRMSFLKNILKEIRKRQGHG